MLIRIKWAIPVHFATDDRVHVKGILMTRTVKFFAIYLKNDVNIQIICGAQLTQHTIYPSLEHIHTHFVPLSSTHTQFDSLTLFFSHSQIK